MTSSDPAPSQARQPGVSELKALIDRLSLRNIRLVRWAGACHAEPPSASEVVINETQPRVKIDSEVSVWFEYELDFHNESKSTVAEIEVGLIADFEILNGEPPDLEVVSLFAKSNAFFMVYPYLREAVQSMSVRLGLDPAVLDVLRRGDERPTELTLVRRPTAPPEVPVE